MLNIWIHYNQLMMQQQNKTYITRTALQPSFHCIISLQVLLDDILF